MDDIFGLGTGKTPAPPSSSAWDDLVHKVRLTVNSLGRGAATSVPYVLDVANQVDPLQAGVAKPQTMTQVLTGQGPITSKVNKAYTDVFGLEPSNSKTDETISAIAQGIGAAAIPGFGELGLGKGLATAGKVLLSGATGGAAAEAGHLAFPHSDLAPVIFGLAGGIAPSAPHIISSIRTGSAIARGSSHPDYGLFVNQIIPDLERGGTIENPATSPKGARGPMQVMPDTAAKPGHGIKPSNGTPEDDVRVGRQLFAVLLDKYDGDPQKALAAYNWGEGNVDHAIKTAGGDWLTKGVGLKGQSVPQETFEYVTKGTKMAYGGTGSVGGPVPPMAPEDMAAAMGEHLGPEEGTPKLVADNGELAQSLPDNAKLSDTIDSHLGEAHQMLQDYADTGESEVASPDEVENYRQGAQDILNSLPKDSPLYPKAQKAVNLWEQVQMQMADEGLGEKPETDPLSPYGAADKFIGQEPSPPEAANTNQPELPIEGGGGKEPPFGGGGEPPSEPPSEPPAGPEDKYAGSINLNRLAISNAAKENIKLMAAPMNQDIETFNETRQKASDLIDQKGVEGVLQTEKVAPKDLAHYATAVRAIHAAAQENMLKLNEEFLNPESNSDIAHLRWQHAKEVLAAAFERNQQVAQGLGRGLGALRIEVGGTEGDLGAKVGDLMKSRASDEEIARMIQEHPEQAGKIARDAAKPGAQDYIFTTWYNLLLSSLKTLSRNVLSNLTHITWDNTVVHPLAAVFGKLHGGEKVTFHEAGARLNGLMQGVVEGFKNAPEAYRQGTPSDFAERTQSYYKIPNKGIGRAIGAPMRVLSAQDQVFLDMGQNAEYFGLAHRQAFKDGFTPGTQEYNERVVHYLENPTASMDKAAVKYGQMMRFQDPMEFKGLEYATRATKKDPLMIKVMKGFLRVLFPFPRNSDRMFFGAMRNSPLGVLEPQNLRDFAAGGAKRDIAMARVFAGTVLAGTLYTWAANGGITGAGPSDPTQRGQWLKNHQPFSINFPGGVHISYQNVVDPFGILIAGIATGVEQAGQKADTLEQKIFRSATALTGLMMSETYAMGASQFFQALDDQTGKTMENFLGRMASSFSTPAIVREVNQDYIDPTVRNTKQHPIVDNVKAGLPELSQTLPARHDIYGDVIKRENPGGMNVINPARVTYSGEQVTKDVDRLAPGSVTKVPSKVNGKTLTAKEQEQYQQKAGHYLIQMLQEDPSWRLMPADQRKARVKEIQENARNRARVELGLGIGGGFSGDVFGGV